MIPLLRRAASHGTRSAYMSKLLDAFGADKEPGVAALPLPDAQPPLDPLTPRELEVLRLICKGLSNQEIAGRLTVTLNTVRKHTRTSMASWVYAAGPRPSPAQKNRASASVARDTRYYPFL